MWIQKERRIYTLIQDTEKRYVHMLNGTLCATERTLCCILENYQTEEGLRVPEVLQPFMGTDFLPYKEEEKPKEAAKNQKKADKKTPEPIKTPIIEKKPLISAEKKQEIKSKTADIVTSSAEKARVMYEEMSKLLEDNPYMLPVINYGLRAVKGAVNQTIPENPNDFGWVDLGNLWFFELRKTSYTFGPNAKTTKDLMDETGVVDARGKAMAMVKRGSTGTFNHTFVYGQNEFYNTTPATAFLGSYNVEVNVKKTSDGFMISYKITNTTSLESASRFRKDNDGDGTHDGIIDSKDRNTGIELGGNTTQTWIWTEKVKR